MSSVLTVLVALGGFFSTNAVAREINIVFLNDTPEDTLGQQIVLELEPLLPDGTTVSASYIDASENPWSHWQRAASTSEVDFIVATGFAASQRLYRQPSFGKATWLLQVIDPSITGMPRRERVTNLRSYSATNELDSVFSRIKQLFAPERVSIVLPGSVNAPEPDIGRAVTLAGARQGLEVDFLWLDLQSPLAAQLTSVEVALLPPVAMGDQLTNELLQALVLQNTPSYAVGGDSMVRRGALISDTLDEDDRVFARRVALDLQSVILRETRTAGLRMLESQQRTSINIDTAEALNINFDIDEVLTARIVRNDSARLGLSFLSAIQQANDRNLALQGQQAQLRIDRESLEQARSGRRPQLSLQLGHTQRKQLPERDSLGTLSLSQSIYSPTTNASVDAARFGLSASESNLEQTRLDTIQQTAAAFFQALQTQAQFESSLRDLALNRENLELATQRKRSGTGTGAEIYRWEATIAASENAVLSAYTANSAAQNRLAQQLDLRLQVPTVLSEVELDQPPFDLLHEALEPYLNGTATIDKLHEAATARALQNSPQVSSAQAALEIPLTNLKALRRSYYTPELSLSAQYSQYIESSENGAGVELDGEDDWSVRLSANLPLFTGGSKSSLQRQYAAQHEQAQHQLRQVRMGLWTGVGNAVDNLVANHRAIELNDRAQRAALKSQQITQNAYRLGAASVTELLDTQNAYLNAQVNAKVARYQYLSTLVELQSLMGEMPMLESGAEQLEWLRNFSLLMQNKALPASDPAPQPAVIAPASKPTAAAAPAPVAVPEAGVPVSIDNLLLEEVGQ